MGKENGRRSDRVGAGNGQFEVYRKAAGFDGACASPVFGAKRRVKTELAVNYGGNDGSFCGHHWKVEQNER